MGGGSGGSHSTEYQAERVGVDRRQYGQLSKTGIQSQAEYDYYKGLGKLEANHNMVPLMEEVLNSDVGEYGMHTDYKWGTRSLKSGVDMDAAMTDWDNYTGELQEIQVYEAKEERRKEAPEELAGTTGNVDYTLGIKDTTPTANVGSTTDVVDESPSTASTSQALGIY